MDEKLQTGGVLPFISDPRPVSTDMASVDHEHDDPVKDSASLQPKKETERGEVIGNGSPGAGSGLRTLKLTPLEHPPKTVAERLAPTVADAQAQMKTFQRRASLIDLALNVLLALQILIGGLITGIAATAAPKSAQIATTILGGLSTLVASGLARARGNGEPDLSQAKVRDLQKFLRDMNSVLIDSGDERPDLDDLEPNKREAQLLKQIDDFRTEYDAMIESWNRKKPANSGQDPQQNA